MEGLSSCKVISGKEDINSLGYFNTGVSFNLFQSDISELAEKLGDGLRDTALGRPPVGGGVGDIGKEKQNRWRAKLDRAVSRCQGFLHAIYAQDEVIDRGSVGG